MPTELHSPDPRRENSPRRASTDVEIELTRTLNNSQLSHFSLTCAEMSISVNPSSKGTKTYFSTLMSWFWYARRPWFLRSLLSLLEGRGRRCPCLGRLLLRAGWFLFFFFAGEVFLDRFGVCSIVLLYSGVIQIWLGPGGRAAGFMPGYIFRDFRVSFRHFWRTSWGQKICRLRNTSGRVLHLVPVVPYGITGD